MWLEKFSEKPIPLKPDFYLKLLEIHLNNNLGEEEKYFCLVIVNKNNNKN